MTGFLMFFVSDLPKKNRVSYTYTACAFNKILYIFLFVFREAVLNDDSGMNILEVQCGAGGTWPTNPWKEW